MLLENEKRPLQCVKWSVVFGVKDFEESCESNTSVSVPDLLSFFANPKQNPNGLHH